MSLSLTSAFFFVWQIKQKMPGELSELIRQVMAPGGENRLQLLIGGMVETLHSELYHRVGLSSSARNLQRAFERELQLDETFLLPIANRHDSRMPADNAFSGAAEDSFDPTATPPSDGDGGDLPFTYWEFDSDPVPPVAARQFCSDALFFFFFLFCSVCS